MVSARKTGLDLSLVWELSNENILSGVYILSYSALSQSRAVYSIKQVSGFSCPPIVGHGHQKWRMGVNFILWVWQVTINGSDKKRALARFAARAEMVVIAQSPQWCDAT